MRIRPPNPAVFLSVFRAVAAVAFFFLVQEEMWSAALLVLLCAAFSDSGDGLFAAKYPHRWNGTLMNDIPSGILSFAAPGAVTVWLYNAHPDTVWFWSWVGACVFFGLGTLWCNRHKGKRYDIDHRVRATVAQGWLYGLLLLAPAIQVHYLLFGTDIGMWLWFTAFVIATILAAKHRWTDRPEVRAEAARAEYNHREK